MPRKHVSSRSVIAVLLALAVAVAAVVYFQPFKQLTLISVSPNVSIEPQGYEDSATGEWTGSYWIISAKVDMTDEIGAAKLITNGTEGYVGNTKLVAKSEITIKIDPCQPYWEIPITYEPVQVYPKTCQGWANRIWGYSFGKDTDVWVPTKGLAVYRFARDYWEAHTPFYVYVYKDGTLIGSKYIDTVGGSESVTIENPKDSKERLTITDLGKIGAAYQMTLGKLVLIESKAYAYDDSVVEQILKYDNTEKSFSVYWFGPPKDEFGSWSRWKDDGSPSGLWFIHSTFGDAVASLVKAPGWEDKSDWTTLRNKPKAATFEDIISYVEKYYPRRNVDVWGQGATIVGDKLRVYMPFGAMSSFITIRISTELADTIVWRPPVANLKIIDHTSIGDVGDRVNFMVKVKQMSKVRSTGKISLQITPSDAQASVIPEYVSPTLNPGEEATFYFTFINLGATQKVSGSVNVVCTELFAGTVTDKVSIPFTLLPRSTEAVSLEVYTIDKETGAKVSGIPVTIKWETNSDLKYTDDGVAVWDMKGYTGTVFISTGETATYKSASTSTTLHSGVNTVTLYLEKQGTNPPTIPDWLIYVVVAVVVVAVAAVIAKKGRGR